MVHKVGGATVISAQLYKAFKAEEKGFTLLDTGSAAGHDASLIKAYEQRRAGSASTGSDGPPRQYEMVKLDFGVPFDEKPEVHYDG